MMNEDDTVRLINACLLSLLGSTQFVDQWWESQNMAFGMLTPAEMWIKDREKVKTYILNQFDYHGS